VNDERAKGFRAGLLLARTIARRYWDRQPVGRCDHQSCRHEIEHAAHRNAARDIERLIVERIRRIRGGAGKAQ
jgi:hypothetical protein